MPCACHVMFFGSYFLLFECFVFINLSIFCENLEQFTKGDFNETMRLFPFLQLLNSLYRYASQKFERDCAVVGRLCLFWMHHSTPVKSISIVFRPIR